MNFLAELKVLTVVMIKLPLVEFHFRRLHHTAILSGDMASEQAAVALLFLSLLCFALLSIVLPRFYLCSYSCITYDSNYVPVYYVVADAANVSLYTDTKVEANDTTLYQKERVS